MLDLKSDNLITRFATALTALLISNVLAVACAMAIEICSDCPEEPPSHCIEMFDDSAMNSADKSTASKSTARLDINPPYPTELHSTPHKKSAATSAIASPPNAVYSSPRINLLNCVFLK